MQNFTQEEYHMKRSVCLIMLVFMLCSLCACNEDDHSLLNDYKKSEDIPVYDFTSEEAEAPEGYADYTAGATEFAFELLSQLASNEDNVVLSPHSAATALSMLANGAANSTRKQFRDVLGIGEDTAVINSGNYYLNSRLSSFNTKEWKMTSANSLWLDDSFDVKPSFLQSAVNYYDAEVQRVVLTDAKDIINEWISENTDGEIREAVGDIAEDTKAIIVNAALFDDEWVTPYEEGDIKDGVFHGAKGDTTASYMTSEEAYLETSFAKGFSKGFAHLPLKFAALLPPEDTEVTKFAESLTANRWQALLDSRRTTVFCKASIPQLDLRAQYSLTDPLKALGLTDAFDKDKADFSALSNSDKMFISDVTQEAFVRINAKGVKAGAATVIKGNAMSAPSEEIKELKFDRPFVFVIYDNESGIPVFTGIVNTIE